MKTKTSKKITAILLCCIFVICGVLSGCSSIENARQEKIFAEIKEKADSYEIEFPGYRLEVVTDIADFNEENPNPGEFRLQKDFTYPENVVLSSGDNLSFQCGKSVLRCGVKIDGKYQKRELWLNSVFQEQYFAFFQPEFKNLVVFEDTVFFVTAQNRVKGFWVDYLTDSCRPSAFFVWDLNENSLKYAGYCQDFLKRDKYRFCVNSSIFRIVEEK